MGRSAIPWIQVERDPEGYARAMRAARAFGPVANAGDVYRLLGGHAAREDTEVAWVVLLDIHGYSRGVQEIARGARDHVGFELPDALRAASIAGARYLVLVHNHPSGWAAPSADDAQLTREVEAAAWESGLFLLDHVVLGLDEWFSFREAALFRVAKNGQVTRIAA